MPSLMPNGEKIRALRRTARLSQEAVAALTEEAAGCVSVSDRTVRAAERGKRPMSDASLAAIAKVLRVSLDDIVISQPKIEPFRGLSAYQPFHSSLFGGRDAVAKRLTAMLIDRGAALCAGPSGSGKSSLCLAGVAPRALELLEGGRLATMHPGVRALDALATALLEATAGIDDAEPSAEAVREIREALARGPDGLADWLTAARIRAPNAAFLIYVDQGEELVTQSQDAADFLSQLGRALERTDLDVRLLISARSDYVGELMDLDGAFFSRFDDACLVLRRMNADELRAALLRPIAATKTPFEPALIDALINDARFQDGYLPHLQFVLKALWDRDGPTGERLTLANYVALGGMAGAISRHAADVYARLSPTDQQIARAALPRLVTLAQGGRDVSAPKPLSDFPVAAAHVLLRLAEPDARILAVDENDVVGFAHEEITRQWPAFRDWLDEKRADLQLRERLESDIAAWRDACGHDDFLAGGVKLNAYIALLARAPPEALSSHAHEFVERSKRHAAQASFARRIAVAAVVSGVVAIAGVAGLVANKLLDEAARAERRAAALTKLKEYKSEYKSKKAVAPISKPAFFFADDGVGAMFELEEIGRRFSEFYPKGERSLVKSPLDDCYRPTGDDLSFLNLGAINFKFLSTRCGYDSLSDSRLRGTLLTQARFDSPLLVLRTEFIGSWLIYTDFGSADLTGSVFPCSDLGGANLEDAKGLTSAQVAEAYCFYPQVGQPRLPVGVEMPVGCQWLDNVDWRERVKEAKGNPARLSPEWRRKSRPYQEATLRRHYLQCLRREDAIADARQLFQRAIVGGDHATILAEARALLPRNQDIRARLSLAPLLANSSDPKDYAAAEEIYSSARGREMPRFGRLTGAIASMIEQLTEAGVAQPNLLRFREKVTRDR